MNATANEREVKSRKNSALCLWLILLLSPVGLGQPGEKEACSGNSLDKALDSIVLIVYGSGAGQIRDTITGAIVRSDGAIMASCAGLDEAREAQVRLRNGEIFDHVTLLGVDRCRCVAALKISAVNLPTLRVSDLSNAKTGLPAYVAHSGMKGRWSLSAGLVNGVEKADQVSALGRGYRSIRFSAQPGKGVRGILLDSEGKLLGVPTEPGDAGPGSAVPISSVLGLVEQGLEYRFGTGTRLVLHTKPLASEQIDDTDTQEQLLQATSIHVTSATVFLKPTLLYQSLMRQPEFEKWNLKLVHGYRAGRMADLIICLDRPLFSYYFTFNITDNGTGVVLGTGKVTAIDGNAAASMLARKIIALIKEARDKKAQIQGKVSVTTVM